MTSDARSRARGAMRRELADVAFEYLTDREYEKVTVDELATAMGVSRATFFRYFETKEDIVLDTAAPAERDLGPVVAGLAESDLDDPLAATFRILEHSLPPAEAQTSRLKARVRLISSTPALGARLAVRRSQRQSELAAALQARLRQPDAAVLSSALAFACLDVAWRRWAHDDSGLDLLAQYKRVASDSLRLARRSAVD